MPTYGHCHLSRDCNCAAALCYGALLLIILQKKPEVRKTKRKKVDLRSLPPVARLQLCCRVVPWSAAAHHTANKSTKVRKAKKENCRLTAAACHATSSSHVLSHGVATCATVTFADYCTVAITSMLASQCGMEGAWGLHTECEA